MFQVLAEVDFRGGSPLYERLATEAAGDDEVLALLEPAQPTDRLPHLLFAAVQYLLLVRGSDAIATFGAQPYATFHDWCLEHRSELGDLVATHVVQTNDVGRAAALLPCLSLVSQRSDRPLAVLEIGASAGLNLLLDRFVYDYGTTELAAGDGRRSDRPRVVLRPQLRGTEPTPPLTVPTIAWRRGLDRLPVDVRDDDAVRWLECCIWPEQRWRLDLLAEAVALAREDPPMLVAGDAVGDLDRVAAEAPDDATLCVVHTAVFGYLPDRAAFEDELRAIGRSRPLWWVSGEAAGLVPALAPVTPSPGISFVYGAVPVGFDGSPTPVVRAGSHGAWIEWLPR